MYYCFILKNKFFLSNIIFIDIKKEEEKEETAPRKTKKKKEREMFKICLKHVAFICFLLSVFQKCSGDQVDSIAGKLTNKCNSCCLKTRWKRKKAEINEFNCYIFRLKES